MALVMCKECSREISDKAEICVGCGAPLKAKPKPIYPNAPQITVVRTAKSRGIYIILGLFLGTLGIHNFYAGYYGRGTAQLVITLLLGWFVIGLVITAFWALIELLAVDRDANGDLMA